MTEPAANYTPLDLQKRFHAQAIRVWTITAAVVLAWLGAIVAAPILSSSNLTSVSSPIYTFFSYICHQISERSLHLAGHQMAVCSRCFGVYFGLTAGVLIYPLWRSIDEIEPIPRFWLFLSLIPISVDWSLTIFGYGKTHMFHASSPARSWAQLVQRTSFRRSSRSSETFRREDDGAH
jgi:uncharacterized membrane protein